MTIVLRWLQATFLNVHRTEPNPELLAELDALEGSLLPSPEAMQRISWLSLALITISGRKGKVIVMFSYDIGRGSCLPGCIVSVCSRAYACADCAQRRVMRISSLMHAGPCSGEGFTSPMRDYTSPLAPFGVRSRVEKVDWHPATAFLTALFSVRAILCCCSAVARAMESIWSTASCLQ